MPLKSLFKKLFIETELGKALQKMSSAKSIPKGPKFVECKRGMCRKNSPIHYILEQDPVQDALEKNKKTMYFKMIFPNTGSKLKVAIWADGTSKQFLFHVCTAIYIFKQIDLDTEEANAMMVLKATYCKCWHCVMLVDPPQMTCCCQHADILGKC